MCSRPGPGRPLGQVAERLNPRYWLPPTGLDVEMGLQQLATMIRSGLNLLFAPPDRGGTGPAAAHGPDLDARGRPHHRGLVLRRRPGG